MKKATNFWIMGVLVASLFVMGCDDDDDEDVAPQKNEKRYTLSQLDTSGVSGSVTFLKQDEQTTKVSIALTGTEAGNSHPAHIHANKASDGGAIVLDLSPVDGATGKSETIVTQLNDGTAITYEELIMYNGHVNVHKSTAELAVMLAQGDVGANATSTPGPGPGNGNNDGTDGY